MYVHEGIEWSFHESMNKRIKIFTTVLSVRFSIKRKGVITKPISCLKGYKCRSASPCSLGCL